MIEPQKSKLQKKYAWNDDQKRLMVSMLGKFPIQDIANRLNKTKVSVRHQANKLGYSIAHPDNEAI